MADMQGPAELLGDVLPATVVGGTSGWTLRIGRLPAIPDRAIAMADTGGWGTWPTRLLDFVTVQAMVRGEVDGYQAAYTKAKEVKDALLGMPSTTMGNGDRIDSILLMGDIALVGYDDKDRPLLAINFRIIMEPAQTTLTNRVPL